MSVASFANIFSHSEGCLLVLFISPWVSFLHGYNTPFFYIHLRPCNDLYSDVVMVILKEWMKTTTFIDLIEHTMIRKLSGSVK